ncbi:hypothetical protein [uncultured Marivirga sp.]|uniref:hypothetical protein n=1 Tax=uncultured Marivirga sp. TaxID=1123707 RepID=UPI0030ED64E0|tara:strand:+ start:68900 stop:69100 length:201 start_codon:yes stop_codon:yes gene_type:complete
MKNLSIERMEQIEGGDECAAAIALGVASVWIAGASFVPALAPVGIIWTVGMMAAAAAGVLPDEQSC